jgi:PERQ amino acid-rich with GYF domain-containing protein
MDDSLLTSFKKLCKDIANSEVVLPNQHGVCALKQGDMFVQTYGVRDASCDDTTQVVLWIALEFVSTMNTGDASEYIVEQHKVFTKLIDAAVKTDPDLKEVQITASTFELAYNETLAVSGAIWAILISLALTYSIVYVFKGSFRLTFLTMVILVGNLGIIVAIFGWLGWKLGGVEAIALSIIVGTSVDYCLHMMEGYADATHHLTNDLHRTSAGRQYCTTEAMINIGVPIVSSAITTAGAALFLSTCELQILKKFGQILVINTLVVVGLALTALPALFAMLAPTRVGSWFKRALVPIVLTALVAVIVVVVFVLASAGVYLKGSDGENLVG